MYIRPIFVVPIAQRANTAEGLRGGTIKHTNKMDENILALLLERERDNSCRNGKGMAATGIGLAAGLGGGALLLAIAGLWGLNQASKARTTGAMAGIAANTATLSALNSNILAERTSRENWQHANTPSIQSYIDVRAQPTSQSVASAAADAYALAAAVSNNGLSKAVGTDSFLKVQRYSAPQPCGCDTCGN